jgi:hypothetical protein
MSGSIALLVEDSALLLGLLAPPAWGIFDSSGKAILEVDSFADIDYARDYSVSDAPQEQGAWESYNKVQQPYQAKIGFLIARSRFAFLQSVEAAAASLQLVSVVTPEIAYPSANITHYGYKRTQVNGVTMIRVEVWLEEIRVTAGTQLGTIQQPVGTINSSALSGNPSATSTDNPSYPIATQSTNAAYPASSGYTSQLLAGGTTNLGAVIPAFLPIPR